MNILFLDDRAVRACEFRTKYPDAVCVDSSNECIRLMQSQAWDLVCLDHDLIGDDTGMRVARWISENGPSIQYVVVHSTNLVKSLEMLKIIRGAGYFAEYLPFSHIPEGPFNL